MVEKSITISVGTIFKVRGFVGITDVVTNTGQDKCFSSLQCLLNENKDDFMLINALHGGTVSVDNILEIVGIFPREVVEKKILEFWKTQPGIRVNREFKHTIHKAISSESRRINLD